MKVTLAPKVAVSLAIFTAACGSAVTITNVAGKLKGLSWAIIPLFVIAGAALVFAVVTIARTSRDTASANLEEQPEDVKPEDLLAIFNDKTEIQAELYARRWLGKRVRLSAEMWDVSSGASFDYMVSLAVSGFNQCYFFIPRSQLNDYTHIQRGTTIAVVGTIAKLAACDLQLEKVQLIKVADQPIA